MKVQCSQCRHIFEVPITVAQILAWRNGGLIQRVAGNLTPSERELLVTQTCGDCFDAMFKDDNGANQYDSEDAAF